MSRLLGYPFTDLFVAALIGLSAFLIVCGPAILLPANVGWLTDPDAATFLFGWRYFRASPWSWPPALNPDYGLSISNSILYSDSIPLLALPLKLLRSFLDVPQYAGIWLLACFVLQAVSGWLLIGLATADRVCRLLGASFLLFMPILLFRIYDHYALCAHWLILLALFFTFRTTPPHFAWWPSLLAAAALTQPYILLGLLPLWSADRIRRRNRLWARSVADASLTSVVTVLAMWLSGYFAVHNGLMAAGYGVFRVNLLSMINPLGWSRVLPNLPGGAGDYEGFAYLGAGGLLLLAVATFAVCTRPLLLRSMATYSLVLLALAGLLAYSITNRIGFGPIDLGTIPLWPTIEQMANVFRASGRLCWPVIYAMVLGCVAVITRVLSLGKARTLLAGALLLQVVDTSAGWQPLHRKLNQPGLSSAAELPSAFWAEAADVYQRVVVVPPGDTMPNWYRVAHFASEHGLPTNAVNFGRIDHDKEAQSRLQLEQALAAGNYEPGTLYVLNDHAANLGALSYDAATDLLAAVDGLQLLAPGWKQSHEVPAGVSELARDDLIPRLQGSVGILNLTSAGSEHDRTALIRGWWSAPEAIGVWTASPVAELAVRLPDHAPDLELIFDASGFVPPAVSQQRVRISVDGVVLDEWSFRTPYPEVRRLRVRRPPGASPVLRVRFDLPDAVSPARLGLSTDWRPIALIVSRVEIQMWGPAEGTGGFHGRDSGQQPDRHGPTP